MRKRIIILILFSLLFFINENVFAENKVNIYFFHGDGCGYCADEETWFKTLREKYQNIEIYEYEVWYNDANKDLMESIKTSMEVKSTGVPFTVIGDQYYLGFNEDIGERMEERIREYSKHSYIDKTGVFLGKIKEEKQGEELEPREETDKKEETIKKEEKANEVTNRLWIPSIIVASASLFCLLTVGTLIYLNMKRG